VLNLSRGKRPSLPCCESSSHFSVFRRGQSLSRREIQSQARAELLGAYFCALSDAHCAVGSHRKYAGERGA